jgi:hypothetical protein
MTVATHEHAMNGRMNDWTNQRRWQRRLAFRTEGTGYPDTYTDTNPSVEIVLY